MRPRLPRWDAVWPVTVATSAIYFLSNPEADNDLWVHVRTGLDILATGTLPHRDSYSYTADGAPWVDHEWLAHVVFAAMYSAFGSSGLLLLKTAVGLATAWLLHRAVRHRAASVHAYGFVMLLALSILSRGFAIRPQIATYAGAALLLWWLGKDARPSAVSALLLPVMFVVWANLHGGVAAGIGILGLAAAGRMTAGREGALRLAVLAAAGAAAAAATHPYGSDLVHYLWRELSAPHPITEWQPISFETAQATFFMLAALFVATLPLATEWRRRGWEIALAAIVLAMAFLQQRHTPLAALATAPLLAENAGRALHRLAVPVLSGAAQAALKAALLAFAAIQLWLTGARLIEARGGVVFDTHDYPAGAVTYLHESGVEGNLAVPLEWGAYTLWHLAPRVRVSIDGRFATLYPPEAVERNFGFFAGRDRRLADELATDMVLAPSGAPSPVGDDGAWRLVYRDNVATLHARRGGAIDRELLGSSLPRLVRRRLAAFP